MFERVLALRLQTMVVDPPNNPRETRATKWARVMPHGGGGRSVSWGVFFREWLDRQLSSLSTGHTPVSTFVVIPTCHCLRESSGTMEVTHLISF